MIETIVPGIVIAVGTVLILYPLVGRICGFHRPGKWQGGGEVTFVGEMACGVFILCVGLGMLQFSGIWVIPALIAWIIGYISQNRANRRHAEEEEALRAANATKYPGIFDKLPPTDIETIQDEKLDLYDAGACTFLGTVSKRDMELFIKQLGDYLEDEPNDIYILVEFLELDRDADISQEFLDLLNQALQERDYLVLRWMPPSTGYPLATNSA